MPVVDLPLGATEDRVVGTIDIEHAIKKGERHFQAGILADANRGILYVDEVNLLDDHLVDILLDVSASGVNEREGISFSHPAQFILVGTMNPEEGELRPQLLDRFGLFVQVQGLDDPIQRATVIRRHLEYEDNPATFVRSWKHKEMESRDSILKARNVLSKVVCPDEMYNLAARMALDFGVHGHRTDLLLIKTAKTIAAFRGHTQMSVEDFQKAASLVLPHRTKKRFSVLHKHEGSDLQELIREWSEDNPSDALNPKRPLKRMFQWENLLP
jgi:Mg-chelatase subunit ChlI